MITRYVDPDAAVGGDGTTNALSGSNCAYPSLNAWEAARQGTLSEVEECICDSTGESHTADTTAVDILGWTTSASNYISIHTPTNHRTSVYSASHYRLECDPAYNGGAINIEEEYTRIEGLQIKVTASEGNAKTGITISVTSGACDVRISKNVIRGNLSGTTDYSNGIGANCSGTAYLWNNFIYAFTRTGTPTYMGGIYASGAGTVYAYNNTIHNCYQGMGGIGAVTFTAKNNIVNDCTDSYHTYFDGSDYNITDSADTGDGGAHSITGADLTFENITAGSENLHVTSGCDAIDAGVSDPGSGLFSDDIDGNTRSGSWDIGADEYASSSYSSSRSDSSTPSETLSSTFSGTCSLSDSSGPSETLTANFSGISDLFDSSIPSESLEATNGNLSSQSDSSTTSESLSGVFSAISQSSDSSTPSETLAASFFGISELSDASSPSETLSEIFGQICSQSDASEAAESLDGIFSGVSQPSDTSTASESLSSTFSILITHSDSQTAAESLTSTYASQLATISDSSGAAENLQSVFDGISSASDASTPSETLSAVFSITITHDDTLTPSESMSSNYGDAASAVSDSSGTEDGLSASYASNAPLPAPSSPWFEIYTVATAPDGYPYETLLHTGVGGRLEVGRQFVSDNPNQTNLIQLMNFYPSKILSGIETGVIIRNGSKSYTVQYEETYSDHQEIFLRKNNP